MDITNLLKGIVYGFFSALLIFGYFYTAYRWKKLKHREKTEYYRQSLSQEDKEHFDYIYYEHLCFEHEIDKIELPKESGKRNRKLERLKTKKEQLERKIEELQK